MTSGFDGFARRLQAKLDQRMEEKTTTAVDLILLEAAWKDDLGCTSNAHPLGQEGHVPEQPASHFVRLECGHTYLVCDGWVAYPAHTVTCSRCGHHQPKKSLTIVPI
jgi:hypothetical protein